VAEIYEVTGGGGNMKLIIVRSAGGNIKLIFKYEKLGKICFICCSIWHTDNLCHKKWGPHFCAENNFLGGGKASSKWLLDGRNSNSVRRMA